MTRDDACKALLLLAKENKAEVSVVWQEPRQEIAFFDWRGYEPMVSASVIKVPIMLAALQQVQRGNISLSTHLQVEDREILSDSRVFASGSRAATLEELLTWMIILSDNTSTNVLIEWLGMAQVNEFCTTLGLANTSLQRKMLDFAAVEAGRNNYTTAQDMRTVFFALWEKRILTEELCATALHILKKQRDTRLLPRYIWEDAVFAHKSGGLDRLSHDAGLVQAFGKWYYLGVFVQNASHIEGDAVFVGQASRIVFDYYANCGG